MNKETKVKNYFAFYKNKDVAIKIWVFGMVSKICLIRFKLRNCFNEGGRPQRHLATVKQRKTKIKERWTVSESRGGCRPSMQQVESSTK